MNHKRMKRSDTMRSGALQLINKWVGETTVYGKLLCAVVMALLYIGDTIKEVTE